MKSRLVILIFGGLLGFSPVFAQETKHEEHQSVKTEPVTKTAPTKADAMKCCEGMDRAGGMKDEMKAKMEKKQQAMKEKVAEKMKAKRMENIKTEGEKPGQTTKDAHAH